MHILMDGNLESLKKKIEDFNDINEDEFDLVYLFNEDNKYPDFNIDLIRIYIKKIKELTNNKNTNFKITCMLQGIYIVDTSKCKDFEEIDNYLRNNFNDELRISPKQNSFHTYGFRKTLSANRKLDEIATKIKNITNNGEALSPFERFMVVYEYVSNYVYNEAGDVMHTSTSHWIPVLEGDKIVCAGYASLLQALCDRIFSVDEVKVFTQTMDLYDKKIRKLIGTHSNNVVVIKDNKYKIDGIFYADACWDSVNDKRIDKPQAFCCIPIGDILYDKNRAYRFDKGYTRLYLSQFDEYQNFVYEIYNGIIKEQYEKNGALLSNVPIKKKDFQDEVEEFLVGYCIDSGERDYYNNFIDKNIIYYDKWRILTKEDEIFLDRAKKEMPDRVSKIFKKVLNKYQGLQVPDNFNLQFEQLYKLRSYINNLSLEYNENTKLEIIIQHIGMYLSTPQTQEILKRYQKNAMVGVIDFESFIVNFIANSRCDNLERRLKEKKKELESTFKIHNANCVKKNLNELVECNSIPYRAFINSYKLIGQLKGLTGKQLKEYVKNRITKSIKRTSETFEVDQCNGCFAKASLNENQYFV